jgi:hypothetical protein
MLFDKLKHKSEDNAEEVAALKRTLEIARFELVGDHKTDLDAPAKTSKTGREYR